MRRSRCFAFTVNNYDDGMLAAGAVFCSRARYAIVGKERGAGGTPHLQCFVMFSNAKTLRAAIRKIQQPFPGAHVEIAEGTPDQNIEYCSKDGDIQEWGERPRPRGQAGGDGNQERWRLAVEAARGGMWESIPPDMLVRFISNLRTLRQMSLETRVMDTLPILDNHWIWGRTGTGKSRAARAIFSDAYLKMKNKWWNGYEHQETIIIDDIDPSHELKFGAMLKEWADHYAFQSETKGGTMVIRPKRVVVTSQYPPEGIFKDGETVAALRRRFNVHHFADLMESEAMITIDELNAIRE